MILAFFNFQPNNAVLSPTIQVKAFKSICKYERGNRMTGKQLLKSINAEVLDSLYGYCYQRCSSSDEAKDLCSEILLAIVKSASKSINIKEAESYIWKIAHNVYADFSEKRKAAAEKSISANPEDVFALIPHYDTYSEDAVEDMENIKRIYREIAFLSAAYRETFIMYYLEQRSIGEIASHFGISDNTVRQRLFSARNLIKKEVLGVDEKKNGLPLNLRKIDLYNLGTGQVTLGDPRSLLMRMLPVHIAYLCRNKAMTAGEISKKLNVPMLYIEEELEHMSVSEECADETFDKVLRKLDNGRFTVNMIILSNEEIREIHDIYRKFVPEVTDIIKKHLSENEEKYLNFPFVNKRIDLNLIFWGAFSDIVYCLSDKTQKHLEEYFIDMKIVKKPCYYISYENYENERYFSLGNDGISGANICGYSFVQISNMYNKWLKPHFNCGSSNLLKASTEQMAIRAIHGIDKSTLNEKDRETAAKAIEVGYLFEEDGVLYTKPMVLRFENWQDFNNIGTSVMPKYEEIAKSIAKELAPLIKKYVPAHLMHEYKLVDSLAGKVVLYDLVLDALVADGTLRVPENGLGAEGVFIEIKE